MRGIIGALLGMVISFLLCLVLLNQPGPFDKIPELLNQPVYFFFIIGLTLIGWLIGHIIKNPEAIKNLQNPRKSKEDTPELVYADSILPDMAVVLSVFLFSIIVYLKSGLLWISCGLVLLVLILWFSYRFTLLILPLIVKSIRDKKQTKE